MLVMKQIGIITGRFARLSLRQHKTFFNLEMKRKHTHDLIMNSFEMRDVSFQSL